MSSANRVWWTFAAEHQGVVLVYQSGESRDEFSRLSPEYWSAMCSGCPLFTDGCSLSSQQVLHRLLLVLIQGQ